MPIDSLRPDSDSSESDLDSESGPSESGKSSLTLRRRPGPGSRPRAGAAASHSVRYVIVCPGCKRQFTSMNELRRHRNHRHARIECSLNMGMPRPLRSGASTERQDLSDSEMETDVAERMMGIRNSGLLDEDPEIGVPPGSDGPVCRVCSQFEHSLHIVCK
jgi:hypothetical protein